MTLLTESNLYVNFKRRCYFLFKVVNLFFPRITAYKDRILFIIWRIWHYQLNNLGHAILESTVNLIIKEFLIEHNC
jgi:hypothetical protein